MSQSRGTKRRSSAESANESVSRKRSRALPKTLSKDEVRRLLEVPNLDTPTGLRNRALVELMLRCGLRVSEATGLKVRDVKWEESKLHLRSRKGGAETYVPVPAATLRGLERWKAVRRQYAAGEPQLITTLKGRPVNRQQAYKIVAVLGRRAGLEHLHPHMLRHTFATEALARGANPVEVQHLLGHADIQTTMIYTHVVQTDLEEKMRSWGDEW